ncbi:Hypothetical protein Tcol_37 [Trichococcus collinsii]|uniref:Uncharacterized protein n=1 Tax=Trichococcus collinsii TaxID=157076 RepID=A0AB37ZX69_9LACT|nr:Hypothetical protein Tcol_37 [Trichococcus collinsii]SDZ92873.1 hypothetical protein SAMN04488525_101646 [Trichococcus collinsii]
MTTIREQVTLLDLMIHQGDLLSYSFISMLKPDLNSTVNLLL